MKRKTYPVSLLAAAILIVTTFSQCKKDEPAPDPLQSAAGVYTGNISDNGRIVAGIKATVTTEKQGQELYIKSIGFSSPSYQLVLTGNCTPERCGMSGQLGGYNYSSSQISADGTVLNVQGNYKVRDATNNIPAQYAIFSFTGSR